MSETETLAFILLTLSPPAQENMILFLDDILELITQFVQLDSRPATQNGSRMSTKCILLQRELEDDASDSFRSPFAVLMYRI